jgi:hypothetical protein
MARVLNATAKSDFLSQTGRQTYSLILIGKNEADKAMEVVKNQRSLPTSKMSVIASKRITVVLALLCAMLMAAGGCLFWEYGRLQIRVASASEQTQIFTEMRTRAFQASLSGAADCLQYVTCYYPSGTRQETGSQLDRMVERERKKVVHDIIAYMRTKTDQDLGADPAAWIQKYVQK